MRTIFRTIICTVAVVLTAVSCQKYIEHSNLIKEGNGTIDISVNGLMGEYTQVDATKSSLVNNIRVCWEGGETVYVYDGTQCLGSLIATLEGEENRYALLSTDGSKHTIKKPAGGTAKLTLVHSPLLTEAPSVNNGVISVSLAQQSGATAPFVAYATLDYNGEESITNLVVAFKFATSVIRINCTGLKANTAITSATLSNVNTACKLTLSGTDAPTVAGEENGIITRTDDAYFAVNRINSEGEAVFQVTVPVLEKASEARVLALAQGSDNFEDKNFTTESLSAALSVNTVCQMVEKYEPSSDVLSGEFSVSATKMVHFSKGNLQATINEKGIPTAWKLAANQYDFLGEGGANKTIDIQAGDVDLFGWSTTSTYYGISTSPNEMEYLGDFVDWGKAIGDDKTWRTLSNDEWKYLLENRTNASKKYGLATVAGYHGIIILPDNFKDPMTNTGGNVAFVPTKENWTYNVYTSGNNWDAMEQAGAVFLPAAGYRYGSSVGSVGDRGYYWSSTASGGISAFYVNFGSGYVYPDPSDNRNYGCSVRLITDTEPSATVAVTGVTLNKNTLDLVTGTNETLFATVAPDNATNKNVTWNSSALNVATVDQTGKVTAISAGTATITVTTTDGAKTATCTVTVKAASSLPDGALNGEFSVSATKMVHFSKGNLQATINEKGIPTAWKLAANQYDFLGEGGANKTIGIQAGDVDLFGWSTASTTYGISTSQNEKDYSGDFVDWGKAIGDGKTWRTLSKDEWVYLFNTRKNASDKFGLATVAGFHGIIILPDNFKDPETNNGNAAFVPTKAGWTKNVYTSGDNWDAMEQAGAVFLPAAGRRSGSSVSSAGDYGLYWSSTTPDSEGANNVFFTSGNVLSGNRGSRDYGFSVRLITESK